MFCFACFSLKSDSLCGEGTFPRQLIILNLLCSTLGFTSLECETPSTVKRSVIVWHDWETSYELIPDQHLRISLSFWHSIHAGTGEPENSFTRLFFHPLRLPGHSPCLPYPSNLQWLTYSSTLLSSPPSSPSLMNTRWVLWFSRRGKKKVGC